MPEVRNFTQGAPAKEQNQPGMFQLTCSCRRVLVVLMGMAACPTCRLVHQINVATRPMTPLEDGIAAALLRGERIPMAEPTITATNNLS